MKSRFRTLLRSAFALATLSLIVPSASAQEKSKVSENAKGAAATQDVSGKSSDDDKKAEATKAENAQFIRITRDKDGEPLELQTNIIPYTIEEGEFAGMQVDLIGAVHIAHREYFQLLNKKFRNYDAVLYELVADPEANIPESKPDENVRHPIGAIQVGMKDALGLQFQLDEIDYKAKNFVHADMSPGEFAQDMTKRGDGFIAMFSRLMGSGIAAQSSQAGKGQDVKMLAALMSKNREVKLRQVMAEQFENMEVQLAGLSDKSGRSTLLTERNAKAFEVLESELKGGKKKIAIFYGAGHLIDMDKRLIENYKAKRGTPEWLTAWKLAE